MLNKENLKNLIRAISSTAQLKTSDIPDIDLYMDQVTTFMDNKMGGLKRNDKDKILTKAMINNYAKAELLIPPKNKKYSKDSMILLILIYKLKQMLSINDIGGLFTHLFEGLKEDDKFLEKVYETVLEIEKDRYSSLEKYALQEMESIEDMSSAIEGGSEQLQCFLMVVMLLTRAETERRLAEKIIDTYF